MENQVGIKIAFHKINTITVANVVHKVKGSHTEIHLVLNQNSRCIGKVVLVAVAVDVSEQRFIVTIDASMLRTASSTSAAPAASSASGCGM